MNLRSLFLVLIALGTALAASCDGQEGKSEADDLIQRVEEGIIPALVAEEHADQEATIEERMDFYDVPGVSIAVIDGGEVAWARGYGLTEAGGGDTVTTTTRFQAASISKPVAAVGTLRLVREGKLSLDDDVNRWLTSWNVPENAFTQGAPVTVRGLLSHSAGLTVHGFPGYAAEDAHPTLEQILDGQPPANTAPIRVDTRPGTAWRYSGGGYTVLQQLLMDATDQPFPEFMEEAVLAPFGMELSTFEQPLPESLAVQAATAHLSGGEPVLGRYHHYPEMAAAGLWTTPSDLARFAVSIQEAAAGASNTVLSTTIAQEMLTPQQQDYGLGPSIDGTGDAKRFSHGGTNHGFESRMVAYIERGQGAVIMTNAYMSHDLIDEILDSIARAYEWPEYPRLQSRTYAPLEAGEIAAYEGRYQVNQGFVLNVVTRDHRLFVDLPSRGLVEIYASEPGLYFSPGLGATQLRFVKDENGRVLEMRVGPDGQTGRFMRVE